MILRHTRQNPIAIMFFVQSVVYHVNISKSVTIHKQITDEISTVSFLDIPMKHFNKLGQLSPPFFLRTLIRLGCYIVYEKVHHDIQTPRSVGVRMKHGFSCMIYYLR